MLQVAVYSRARAEVEVTCWFVAPSYYGPECCKQGGGLHEAVQEGMRDMGRHQLVAVQGFCNLIAFFALVGPLLGEKDVRNPMGHLCMYA